MRTFDGGVNLSYFLSHTTFWFLLTPVAGVVFGLSGWLWCSAGYHWVIRAGAVAFFGGVIAGESAFMAFSAHTLPSGDLALLSSWIVVGLMTPVVLLEGHLERLAGIGLTICFLAAGFMTVPVIRWLVDVTR